MGDVIPLEYGDTVTCLTASGGGYGDPFEREVALVLEDVTLGLVSVERAKNVYGVVIDKDTLTVDEAATKALRASK
jgi:N-methylhydantoinase B/oxoprolinase/acetone carboxylase alpha subunit